MTPEGRRRFRWLWWLAVPNFVFTGCAIASAVIAFTDLDFWRKTGTFLFVIAFPQIAFFQSVFLWWAVLNVAGVALTTFLMARRGTDAADRWRRAFAGLTAAGFVVYVVNALPMLYFVVQGLLIN